MNICVPLSAMLTGPVPRIVPISVEAYALVTWYRLGPLTTYRNAPSAHTPRTGPVPTVANSVMPGHRWRNAGSLPASGMTSG